MGVLRRRSDGRSVTLGSRVVVGRGSAAFLQFDHPAVSAEHAAVYWHGDTWNVRDLGSTNGTTVDGEALDAGQKRRIAAGSELRFGSDDEELAWILERDGVPIPRALQLDGDQLREARSHLLLLPDEEAPSVSIYCDEDRRWIADAEDGVSTVEDQSEIEVDGARWRLLLPPPDREREISTTMPAGGVPMVLDACRLELRVSRDEEYVEVVVHCGLESLALPPRTFHYTLLTLARQRIRDAELPPAEQGWMYTDELASQLGTSKPKLNLDICRARQQLAELGVQGAGRLVQRRKTSHQLRLGAAQLTVSPVGD